MSYIKADNILPKEIIDLIQKYVDGEYIYIPRKDCNRKVWGETTSIKSDINSRNRSIYINYLNGTSTEVLANDFYLSVKSIQRIVLQEKNK